MKSPKCLFLVGPTASGKSELAVQLAENLKAEIVNLDSVQIYRELNVGAAKPSKKLLERVPHHFFDLAGPGEELTAADLRRHVFDFLKKYNKEFVVLTGGSGFYLKAILQGMYDLPKVSEEIKAQVESLGDEVAYQLLREKDPKRAEQLNANDIYRIKRALEICLSTGQSMTDAQENFAKQPEGFPYPYQLIGLQAERDWLRERVALRTEEMLKQGMIEEVKGLLDQGYESWRPLSSVGYRQVMAYLKGDLQRDHLTAEINQSTMKLVKKQMTFFRGQFDVQWFEVGTSVEKILEFIRTEK